MRKEKNIWIIFNSRKGGHTYPSRAFYDYLKTSTKNYVCPALINLLDFSPLVSFIDEIGRYGDLKLKGLYKKGYRNLQKENKVLLGSYRLLEGLFFKTSKIYEKLVLRHGKPNIIISLQPEVNVIAPLLKNWFDVPIHTIIIDLAIHGLWVNKWIDRYYVPNEPLKEELVKYKIHADKISVTGMPLRAGFAKIVNNNIKETRKKLNISPELPTILLMAGLLGTMIDFHAAIQSIINMALPFQLLVVFGKNEEGLLNAQSLRQKSIWPIHLFGTVSNVDEMMWASDIIVSKPGSVTMAEALSLGKPMVVITPRAGSAQELRFAKFLQDNGAGEWIESADKVGNSLKKIYESKNVYETMCKNAWRLGHHSLSASKAIFENIKKVLQ